MALVTGPDGLRHDQLETRTARRGLEARELALPAGELALQLARNGHAFSRAQVKHTLVPGVSTVLEHDLAQAAAQPRGMQIAAAGRLAFAPFGALGHRHAA